jgi:predicted ATPase
VDARTKFIGRAREVSELAELVLREPLVTVLGPGGMGKTRVVRELLSRSPAPSIFCDLTRAATLPEVRAILGDALGIELEGDDPEAQLAAAIAARGNLWLVLDNLEQLAQTVPPLLSRVLAKASEARIIGTSRVALRMPEEVLYELGPILLPCSADGLAASDAFLLWVDRVKRLLPSYDAAREDQAELSSLLSELDGNPLAIELCATHARSLSAAELRRMLSERFSLLAAGSRAWAPRHSALGSVIETSWEALTLDEKNALSQLTVLPGSFTMAAALAVVSLRGGRANALAAIESLRDQSLLATQGERLAIYESIRAFVEERGTDTRGARARHAVYFAAIADETLSHEARSSKDRDARRALVEAERRSLAAVAFGDAPEEAVVCLAALDVLHPVRDPGLEFLDAVRKNTRTVLADERPRRALAYALALLGFAERRDSRYERADATLARAADLAAELSMTALAWDVRAERATVSVFLGKPEREIEEELTAIIAAAPLAATGRACATRALVRQDRGLLEEARAWNQRALEGLLAATPSELAYALLCLFEIELDLGATTDRDATLARAQAIQERLGDRRLKAYISNMRAWSVVETDPASAVALYEDALQSAPTDGPLAGILLGWQGVALFVAKRYGEARVSLERALPLVKAKMQHAILLTTDIAARALVTAGPLDDSLAALREIEGATPTDRAWQDVLSALLPVELASGERLGAALESARRVLARPRVGVLGRLGGLVLARAVLSRAEVPNQVIIAEDGSWFERAGSPRVSLATQALPALLLAAMARAHAEGDRGLTIGELFAIGWPDEKASPVSVEERVRAVVKRLRRAGLGDLLEAHAGGFRLSKATRVGHAPR